MYKVTAEINSNNTWYLNPDTSKTFQRVINIKTLMRLFFFSFCPKALKATVYFTHTIPLPFGRATLRVLTATCGSCPPRRTAWPRNGCSGTKSRFVLFWRHFYTLRKTHGCSLLRCDLLVRWQLEEACPRHLFLGGTFHGWDIPLLLSSPNALL